MSLSNQSVQSYYMEFLRCAKCSHDFEYENSLYHPITLPIYGHTMCRQCFDIIRNQTKCPQDHLPKDNEERYEKRFGDISLIIKRISGIYTDLDVFPCSRQVEKLRLSSASFIIPRSASGSSLINHFLVAPKSSPVIDFILHEIAPLKFYRRIYIVPCLEFFSIGSIFLTRVIRKYIKSLDF
ncbi:unnamed protein product [Rotaria sp. Silwood1]|nr:unnamed protein product [Rotaria sp. Silwood1]CAF1649716.1 unnamed protein product [Rotaria sp. Silwood1]CAF3851007.1 unnamed protein product [Rotaria sp. Silwood1]CAF4851942.1 unnamed protein product [Rotaria sp. Silwood1]